MDTPPRHPTRRPCTALLATLGCTAWLGGCATEATPGWQQQLTELVPSALQTGPDRTNLAPPSTAPLAAGDEVTFQIDLIDGGTRKSWRLAVAIDQIVVTPAFEGRFVADFEDRVQPGEARRLAIAARREEFRLRGPSLAEMYRDLPVAQLAIVACDATGQELRRATSSALVGDLQRGLLSACHAGHRRRDVMQGRVEAGKSAPLLTLDDAAYDDVRHAGAGAAKCEALFRILQANPVTRQILFEVLALPSWWSILTQWGVRVTFTVDFFAAERVASPQLDGGPHELWSVPVVLLLNGQPGLLARVLIGPSGAPNGAVAGIHGLIARHPSDASRQVVVRLVASRRGAADDASAPTSPGRR